MMFMVYCTPLFILCALFNLALTAKAEAKEVQLFANGQAPIEYPSLLKSVEVGDVLIFSGGRRFEVKELLGIDENGNFLGNRVRVFGIGNQRVLRVPINATRTFFDSMFSFVEGQSYLQQSGIPVVRVFHEESLLPEFLVVERLDFKMTLKQFLKQNPRPGLERALEKLYEFARSSYKISTLGDFDDRQVVWDGERWILVDFTDMNFAWDGKNTDVTIFNSTPLGSSWLPDLREKLMDLIQEARKTKACEDQLLQTPQRLKYQESPLELDFVGKF